MATRMIALLAAMAWSAAQAQACSDTPGWANDCVAASGGACKPTQFPYGRTPGYWNASGPDAGWTCAMYADARTGWCKDGKLAARPTGGARYNFPERNCCACGKGRPQPPGASIALSRTRPLSSSDETPRLTSANGRQRLRRLPLRLPPRHLGPRRRLPAECCAAGRARTTWCSTVRMQQFGGWEPRLARR